MQAYALSFAALVLGFSNMSLAATASAQFRVTATIVAYCQNANITTTGHMNQAAGVGASQATAASLAVTCNQGAPYQVALQDINDATLVKAAPLFDWSSSKQIGSGGAESETRVLTLSF